MNAGQKYYRRKVLEDGTIIEMRIWEFKPNAMYPLGLRYSLFCVKYGKILFGFDNHHPKGPHVHVGENESKYEFKGLKKLLDDFKFLVGELMPCE